MFFDHKYGRRGVEEIIYSFDSHLWYGSGLDWTDYSVHYAGRVMLLYLERLLESIVPLNYYERLCERLRREWRLVSFGPEEETKTIRVYQELIDKLSSISRHIFLYILYLLALFASERDLNKVDPRQLVALFQPSLLTDYRRGLQDSRLNQDVLIFLLEHQDSFFLDMPGTSWNDKHIGFVRHLYDIIELDEPAPQDVIPNRTLADTPLPRHIAPAGVSSGSLLALDVSDWETDEAKEQTVVGSSKQPKIPTSHAEKALSKRLGHCFVGGNEPRIEYNESEIADIS
jgi:hypothetical protein